MSQAAEKIERRGRNRLDDGCETVLMGIKVPADLKRDFDAIADRIALTPSQLARIVLKSFVDKSKV